MTAFVVASESRIDVNNDMERDRKHILKAFTMKAIMS